MYEDGLDFIVEAIYNKKLYPKVNASINSIIGIYNKSKNLSVKQPEREKEYKIYKLFLDNLVKLGIIKNYTDSDFEVNSDTYKNTPELFNKVKQALTDIHKIWVDYVKESQSKNDSWLYLFEKQAARDCLTSFKNYNIIADFNTDNITFNEDLI